METQKILPRLQEQHASVQQYGQLKLTHAPHPAPLHTPTQHPCIRGPESYCCSCSCSVISLVTSGACTFMPADLFSACRSQLLHFSSTQGSRTRCTIVPRHICHCAMRGCPLHCWAVCCCAAAAVQTCRLLALQAVCALRLAQWQMCLGTSATCICSSLLLFPQQ
jgi:hypothetical protein